MLYVVIVFIASLLIGLPIAFVLGFSGIAHLFAINGNASVLITRLFSGINNFTYMCIPFFVLAGELMNKGGITKRLINFADDIIGHVQGGLAYVTIIVAMILSAILGSANAVAAMLCAVMVPELTKRGYEKSFSGALIAGAGVLGPIIPPSMTFIIYGVLTNTSINKLSIGGIVPGLLLGLGFALVVFFKTRKMDLAKHERASLKQLLKSFVRAIPPLLVPVIMMAGVMLSVFTPTESGAIACLVAVILGFCYKTLKISDFKGILIRSALTSACIMIIISFGSILGWTLAKDNIPQLITSTILGITSSKVVIMILIFIFLLFLGCVMDAFASMVIFAPVFSALATGAGIDPVFFGLEFTIVITLGIITPPVGMQLFVVSNISKIELTKLSKQILPFAIVAFAVMFGLIFVPDVVSWLPNLLGN